MSEIGMSAQSDEQRSLFEDQAVEIVEQAGKQGLTLRVLGSLAFHMQCPKYGRLQKEMGRAYTDIDFAGYKSQSTKVAKFLLGLGYKEDLEVNTFFGGERLIFNHPTNGLHVDVFFDRLNFCHEVNWVGRLEAENWTLPLAEMLMEKMQIVRLNEKDLIDTIMLLLEHPLGDSDQETIHIDRVSKLCARDWGLWRTLTMNLEKVGRLGQEYTELSGDEKEKLVTQVSLALKKIEDEPKSLGWKMRSKVGDRVKWYQEVDDIT